MVDSARHNEVEKAGENEVGQMRESREGLERSEGRQKRIRVGRRRLTTKRQDKDSRWRTAEVKQLCAGQEQQQQQQREER